MLQCRCRHSKLQRLLQIGIVAQAVNQATHKGVAAAHTIDNVSDVISLRRVELLAIVEHSAPGVVVGID